MPMAPARSDTEVPSKPFAQKSRIAVASASCVQNSRGRPLRALWSAPAIRPGQSAASCRNPVGDIDDLGLGELLEAFDALLAADTGLLGPAERDIERPVELFVHRTEERRVGKEVGSTGRSRWSTCHYKTHNITIHT